MSNYERVVAHRKAPNGAGFQYQLKIAGRDEFAWEAASRMKRDVPQLIAAFEEVQRALQNRPGAEGEAHDSQDALTGDATEMARMRQQLDEQARLIQQMAASATPASAGSRFAKAQPRAQELDEYHGAAGPKLDEWLEKLGRTCALYSLNDQETLQFACSRLTGAALQWWNVLLPGDRSAIVDRASLASALRKRFQPITTERMARDQLHNLRQTGDVNAYIAEHQRLSALIPKMDDATALHSFEHGLRADIAEKLRVQGVATLNEAITMAARIGGLMSTVPTRAAGPSGYQPHPSRLHQMEDVDAPGPASMPSAADARLDRLEGMLLNAMSHHSFGAEGPQGGYMGLGAKSQTKRGYQQSTVLRQSRQISGRAEARSTVPAETATHDPGVPDEIVRRRWDNRQCVRCGEAATSRSRARTRSARQTRRPGTRDGCAAAPRCLTRTGGARTRVTPSCTQRASQTTATTTYRYRLVNRDRPPARQE